MPGDAPTTSTLAVPDGAPQPHVPKAPQERGTRKPLPLWDRIKFLLLLATIWFVLVWAAMADNPLLPFVDAARQQLTDARWVLVLFGIEVLRQLHFLVSEHWAAYNRFWTEKVFGGFDRLARRHLSDWTRFRLGRVLKALFWVAVLAVVLGQIYDTTPVLALFKAPAAAISAAPFILQFLFFGALVIFQFVAIFWFLSRGGVETYMPEDIKTRFSDVWGQDHVVERVRENMMFLDDPEAIEKKGGYVPGGILLWGPPGTGKGQPVSAFVMTPTGPRRMGELLPGDEVIGSDGRPTRISEVHLLGERDLFRVSFSDRTSLLVTEDHLWHVSSRYGGVSVRATSALVGRLTEADGRARYRIPMVAPVEFDERELPLDPYVLGALLGDGSLRTQLHISSADEEILTRFEQRLPLGDSLARKSQYDWSVIGGSTRVAIKQLDLLGHYSYEKWIPDDYLWASSQQRLELLRGLMDTDGYVDKRGVVEYHTTSIRLAQGVQSLVQSFGGTSTLTRRVTRYTHAGERRRGREVFLVRIALPPDVVPFTLGRKIARLVPRTKHFPQRRIVSIERAGREESRCLRVDAADHLYVTEHYIVTHNTLMAEAVAGETGKPYVFVDPGAFIQMFMGVGILKVKSLFRKLRKLALRYGGVIVFFDEADSLGSRGTGAGQPGGQGAFSPAAPYDACNGASYLSPHTQASLFSASLAPTVEGRNGKHGFVMGGMNMGGGGMGTLQALLTELSGLKKPRGFVNRVVRRMLGMRPKPPPKYRILVMMATNMPNALDEALLRPGRIDRIYHVGYPSKEGRKRTYEGYFDKVTHSVTEAQIDRLATITPYATGATIKDLVNESLIVSLRDDREVITWDDVLRAKLLKSVGPSEGVEYIERERHSVAVHEACHALISYLTQRGRVIDTATIQKGQGYLGFVQPIPIEERFTSWRSEYEADVMVSLASLVGERMFFGGDNSSGVSGDLQSATTIALAMQGLWGMGPTYGSYAVTRAPANAMPIADGSDRAVLEGALGQRVETILGDLAERTEALLRTHRRNVLALAHALETHRTISGEDVVAVMEGKAGPIVDGRVYHSPDFDAVVEDYHLQALAAHQGREHAMALPPLSLVDPIEDLADDDEEDVEQLPAMRVSGAPNPWARPGAKQDEPERPDVDK